MKNALNTFQSLLLPILDVILPERERAARVRRKELHDFALTPTTHTLLGTKIITLLDYKDPAVADLVRALKYEHSGKAADLCAGVLTDYLREEIASMRTFSAKQIVLIPMPLHPSRERERGFNQMLKVFARLPQEFKDGSISHVAENTLTRVNATPQQARLSRAERLRNVEDAFVVNTDNLRGTHCILVDDVTTTGATLVSAAKPLRKAGAVVTLLSLARA
jgi:ComF family protein